MAHYHINILFSTNILYFLTGKLVHTRHTLHTFYLAEFNCGILKVMFESLSGVLLLVFH